MKDLIKEVALEVAKQRYVVAHSGTGEGIDFSNYAEFATAFLAELSKRAEAVGEMHEAHTKPPKDADGHWCKEILLYSPNNPGDLPKYRAPVFTFPPIHDIEPALSRYKRHTEGEDEPNPIERLRFFLSLALHGQDWIDVEPFINDIEAIENRVAEAICEMLRHKDKNCFGAHNYYLHAANCVEEGEWRKYK